eukprot:8347604-Alexandrium_andersonii.AAC.1
MRTPGAPAWVPSPSTGAAGTPPGSPWVAPSVPPSTGAAAVGSGPSAGGGRGGGPTSTTGVAGGVTSGAAGGRRTWSACSVTGRSGNDVRPQLAAEALLARAPGIETPGLIASLPACHVLPGRCRRAVCTKPDCATKVR